MSRYLRNKLYEVQREIQDLMTRRLDIEEKIAKYEAKQSLKIKKIENAK